MINFTAIKQSICVIIFFGDLIDHVIIVRRQIVYNNRTE